MASEGNDIQKLTERIDALVLVNERLINVLSQSLPSATAGDRQTNPVATSITIHPSPSLPPTKEPPSTRGRRDTLNTQVSALDLESFKKPSLFTGEESSESEDDESFFVQDTLDPESFNHFELKNHVRNHAWEPCGQLMLDDILGEGLKDARIVPKEIDTLRENGTYHHTNVYEVGSDGSALSYKPETQDLSQAIWQSLSNTNTDANRHRKAVGRIVIVREPASLLWGAVHLTMNKHFHMDQLFRLLIDDTPSKAYMKGCLKNDPRQQRSFVFSFKYHCIVGDSCQPKRWQKSDHNLESSREHIPITTCSSIVALSLSGNAANTLRRRSRRAKTVVGQIFDPFAPWRLLSMQCFPDWESTVDVHEQNRHYVNGPEAFLVTVLAEYKDAATRLRDINDRIVALVTPPATFMFDGDLRDKLLFEDRRYTFSRRYFWAFQTLAMMNDNIEAMIDTYKETFTDEVWTGEHRYIWPGTKDQSSRYSNWRKKMASLQKQFEVTIKDLQDILALNVKEQKDIKSLRDQLFSGTSVRESREAIQQQDNIKLLTLVTIFFLPLTFVTSVFGMTNMPQNDNFVRFGITTATICLPSYLLIFSLSSDTWIERYQRWWTQLRGVVLFPTEAQRSKNSWIGMFQTRSPPPPQNRRQSQSVTAQEGMALRSVQSVSRFTPQDGQRPSFPQGITVGSKESAVKFDTPTYGNGSRSKRQDRPLTSNVEKNLSDSDPLSTLPEEEQVQISAVKRGFLKSLTDRFNGQDSSRSPV